MSKRNSIYFLSIITIIYAAVSIFHIVTTSAPDFSVFYKSAQNLITGKNIYQDQTLFTAFNYPPYTLLPFLPLTILPYWWSQLFLVTGSFLLLLICLHLSLNLVGIVNKENFLLAFSFAFLSFPTRFTLAMGQVNLVALFFILYALTINKKKIWLRALVLAMSFILKPQLILLVPIFLIKGEWLTVVRSLTILLTTAIIVGFSFGFSQYVSYQEVIPKLMVFSGRDIYYNQGISGFFSRIAPSRLAADATLVISLIIITYSLWLIFNKKLLLSESVFLFFPVLLAVEPLSWQHHYVFLIPSFVLAWNLARNNRLFLSLITISYLLVSLNLKNTKFWLTLPAGPLIISHVLWGNLMLGVTVLFLLKQKYISRNL